MILLELIVIALNESMPSGKGTNKAVHDGVESVLTMRGIRSVRRSRSNKQSTARDPVDETHSFRITHLFHPLRGKAFKLIERRTTWGEDRVYFRDEKDEFRRIPTTWTSVSTRNVFETISAGRSHFRGKRVVRAA